MNILICCEESQRVTMEFRKRGHNAYSCDIQECSGGHPEWHVKGDALELINGRCIFETEDGQTHWIVGRWDMLIAFPPCTYLTNCGNRSYSERLNPIEKIERRKELRKKAVDFFMKFTKADCPKIVIENPVGWMNSHYRKPDQIIHPYYFGDNEKKRTCLWLKGVQCLKPTDMLPEPKPERTYIKKDGRVKNVYFVDAVKGKGRAKLRSKTFFGVARAMANQWG